MNAKQMSMLIRYLEEAVPGFQIKYKDEKLPWWVKVAFTVVGLFNKRIWDRYTTTIGKTVYFPTRPREREKGADFVTLAHEGVHLQERRISYLYLMPQQLCLLALLGLIWWQFYLFALFLVPMPSPWRVHYEMRAYAMTIAATYWRNGRVAEKQLDAIADQFTTWAYYKMSWRRRNIESQIGDVIEKIRSGSVLTIDKELSPYFKKVKEIIENKE